MIIHKFVQASVQLINSDIIENENGLLYKKLTQNDFNLCKF